MQFTKRQTDKRRSKRYMQPAVTEVTAVWRDCVSRVKSVEMVAVSG